MNECEHKWVFMETVKQRWRGRVINPSISPQKKWKRIDRFYCEKCLEIKARTCEKETPGYEEKTGMV